MLDRRGRADPPEGDMPQGTQKAMMELVGRVFEVPAACFEVRTEIAKVCQEMADKCGEPPLDKQ